LDGVAICPESFGGKSLEGLFAAIAGMLDDVVIVDDILLRLRWHQLGQLLLGHHFSSWCFFQPIPEVGSRYVVIAGGSVSSEGASCMGKESLVFFLPGSSLVRVDLIVSSLVKLFILNADLIDKVH
jgi:hypothetical protein